MDKVELREQIIDVVSSALGQRHIWMWLTKRPARMVQFDAWLAEQGIDWPSNLWAMTSLTTQATAEPRVSALLKVRARVHAVSCEPMLGPLRLPHEAIDLWGTNESPDTHTFWGSSRRNLGWVICGGASGKKDVPPMHPAWPRALRDQCAQKDIPFFFKQWGNHLPVEDALERDINGSHVYVAAHEGCKGLKQLMVRVPKHKAGRLLDGQEHNELPAMPRLS
jgi:protein gp37